MTDIQAGSTVPRRQLGRYLRDLRSAAGITVRAAARELERSEPTIWRIEAGLTSTRSVEVKLMCELYGATAEMTEALMALAKETKARGWWQAYGDVVPEWLDLYIGLEAAANRISWYEPELVPGLFQTENYARELIRVDLPDDGDTEINRRVQLKLTRQAILRRPIDPPLLKVLLRESVLRCPVGGPAVMASQLDRLVGASELPNVSLRVMPFAAGFYSAVQSGSFEILRFPPNANGEDSEPPTVYSDLYTGALYLDKPREVARYDQAFGRAWEVALDEDTSRTLLRTTAEELR